MSPEKIAQIRERLGIASDTKTTLDGASAALKRRFTPLTREQVRDILRHDVTDALAAKMTTILRKTACAIPRSSSKC